MSSPIHNGTEEVLKVYYPPGGFVDHKAIHTAIDLIEGTKTNEYLTDSAMARLTDNGKKKAAHFRRLMTFQLVINLIDESLAIVGPSTDIDGVRANYVDLMKVSEKALSHLTRGASSDAGKSSGLKRPKSVEVPKFDINKPGMQTFLNSMELVTKSYKFDSDKDLARYYLNNLTENSKTLIFAIHPIDDKSFYESSAAVKTFLQSFISPNIRIDALRDIRVLKMTENGGLKTYYKSFTQLVADLGPNQMSQETLVLYFIAGLHPNALHNTNLNVYMHTYYTSNPTSSITDLYAEANKVISLAGTNNGRNGLGKRAGPSDGGQPRPQQREHKGYNGYSQRPQLQHRQHQRPQQQQRPYQKRPNLICDNCGNPGHSAENCRSSWTRDGKWIGKGQPPPGDYWTHQHAKNLKAKTAMVNTPQRPRQLPQQPSHQSQLPSQHQQQQPPQRQIQKKKKVAFKVKTVTLSDHSVEPAVKAITLADSTAAPVLDGLCQDQWESDESMYSCAESQRAKEPSDQRVVTEKITAWHIGSEELDLDTWTLANKNKRRVPAKDRLQEPNTYANKLKGPVPGPSAKPLEQLRFLKKSNNKVRR